MSPKHETVKSCPSACQHSSAQLPPKEPASPCLRQPMTLSPGFRIMARLSGAVPPKKFPALTHTHHASARLKLASQLLCYSASLGCTNAPHHIYNLGVSLCMHWVDDEVDDGDKLCFVGSQSSGKSLPAHMRLGITYCRVIFGPSPSTRRCLGGWGQSQSS